MPVYIRQPVGRFLMTTTRQTIILCVGPPAKPSGCSGLLKPWLMRLFYASKYPRGIMQHIYRDWHLRGRRGARTGVDAETLTPRTEATECCDEPGEDCSGAPRGRQTRAVAGSSCRSPKTAPQRYVTRAPASRSTRSATRWPHARRVTHHSSGAATTPRTRPAPLTQPMCVPARFAQRQSHAHTVRLGQMSKDHDVARAKLA